jgi:hypothetical protein
MADVVVDLRDGSLCVQTAVLDDEHATLCCDRQVVGAATDIGDQLLRSGLRSYPVDHTLLDARDDERTAVLRPGQALGEADSVGYEFGFACHRLQRVHDQAAAARRRCSATGETVCSGYLLFLSDGVR